MPPTSQPATASLRALPAHLPPGTTVSMADDDRPILAAVLAEGQRSVQVWPYLPAFPLALTDASRSSVSAADVEQIVIAVMWEARHPDGFPVLYNHSHPDSFVIPLIVEREALALPELRLLFQTAPMPAARRDAVRATVSWLWPLGWGEIDLGEAGILLHGVGRTWLALGETIDARVERIAAAVWLALGCGADDRFTLQFRVHAMADTDEAGMIEYVLAHGSTEELE